MRYDKINMCPVPVSVGLEASSVKNQSEGAGVGSHNENCLHKIYGNEQLGTMMGCGTHSPNRVKTGSEAKILSYAGANMSEENTKPRKLNFEECEINRTPHVALGITGSKIKRRTGIRNEKELLEHALMLCNSDLDSLYSSNSKLTWFEEWFLYCEFGWGRTLPRWIDVSSSST